MSFLPPLKFVEIPFVEICEKFVICVRGAYKMC